MDTDSEEDPEIDASATLTSNGVTFGHQAFASKRLKTHHSKGQATSDFTAIATEAAAPADSPYTTESPGEEKTKNQVRLSNFMVWILLT